MQSQAWFDIAQRVDALLIVPGARERFRERVRAAAAEWLRRSNEKRQRQDARSEAVKRTGVPYGDGRLPADPRNGAFHWLEDLHDGRPPMESWLPADLSPDLDPDDGLPLPVPANREVSLAERYAVLAAVWDALWKGDEQINPWVDDEFCPEGNYYRFLVHRVKADDTEFSPAGLSDQDEAVVQTWIADVEADLDSGKPAAVSVALVTSGGKPVKQRKATVAARMYDLIRKDLSTHTWTAREFATRLECSLGSVAATPAWKELVTAREMKRQHSVKEAQRRNPTGKPDWQRKQGEGGWDAGVDEDDEA